MSTRDNTNKRHSQPGTLIGVRLQPGNLARIDKWIRDHRGTAISRPEAIRPSDRARTSIDTGSMTIFRWQVS